MSSQLNQAGVTLIELLVVITIATILMAIGVPSYKYVTTSNRVANEINALLADMQFARYEAVKEGLTVQVCPVAAFTPPTTPPTACAASATWSTGWIVLSNAAATGGTPIVLRRQLPFSNFNSQDTLTNTSPTAPTAPISFNREGFAGLTANVRFSLYDPNSISSYTRCLIIGMSGDLSTAQAGATVWGTTCS
ncbi:MAG TPA: GspH/FimT family pseudopilin [Steroidobacteraceae bacterium]|nr:GspH/FimT family pseudopilin [Steroidobacteraceae bacterium]